MRIEWSLDTASDPALLTLLQTVGDAALVAEGIQQPCAVHVQLCDEETIRQINRDWRQVDKATDVLSFPLAEYPAGKTAGSCASALRACYDDSMNACMLGDLVISVPHIYRQAEEYGHSPRREAAYLFAHGLCHLMGYDHMEAQEKEEMRAMEEKILGSIGLERDGQQQVSDDALLALAIEARERSYSPYSGFAVGAALLCDNGRVFQGCNIENASFGLTNCAERTAVFKAVSEGERNFTAIAIASAGTAPWPCGACRQVLNEFAPGIRVLVTWDGQRDEAPLQQLLPHGFGPNELNGSAK